MHLCNVFSYRLLGNLSQTVSLYNLLIKIIVFYKFFESLANVQKFIFRLHAKLSKFIKKKKKKIYGNLESFEIDFYFFFLNFFMRNFENNLKYFISIDHAKLSRYIKRYNILTLFNYDLHRFICLKKKIQYIFYYRNFLT